MMQQGTEKHDSMQQHTTNRNNAQHNITKRNITQQNCNKIQKKCNKTKYIATNHKNSY